MHLLVRLARALVLCAGPAALAACAGTVHMATGAVPQRLPNGATIRITIPKPSASGRGAQYVSPATTQMTIDIEQGGVAVSGYPQTIGLTPTSTGCTSTLANTLCQLSLALAPGAYTATISLLDASNNALSSAQSVPFTVVAGTNNTIPIVLGGIPHAIDLTPMSAPNSIGPSGLEVLGMQSIAVAAYATDADDNIIVGLGAPTMTASVSSVSSGSGIGVTSPSSTTPNTLAISSTGYGTATLTVVATPSNGSAIQTQLPVTTGYYVTTIAGSGTAGGFADGTGGAARFNAPGSIAYDPASDDLYAADTANCSIRQVTTAGVVTTIAGANPASCGFADGTGSAAKFNAPDGIAYDPENGFLYVADTSNCAIRQVTTAGAVTTLAGAGPYTCGFASGTGSNAHFNYPLGVTLDTTTGNLYVADSCGIPEVTTAGVVTLIAGNTCGFANGTGGMAEFNRPNDIAYDSANGELYVADTANCSIRQVTTAGVVTTIAGANPASCGFADGTGSAAKFNHPYGIAYDSANGELYVADSSNCAIRQVTTAGVVTTVAGYPGSCRYEAGFNATMTYLRGLTFDQTNGILYATDSNTIEAVEF